MDTTYAVDVSDKWGEKMSRLIRYDDAIERLGAHLMADAQIDWGGTASTDIEDWKELADMILNGVPTIDAVEVVRCKDCKKWGYSAGLCRHWSKLYGSVLTRADDFCSYGERKDHE